MIIEGRMLKILVLNEQLGRKHQPHFFTLVLRRVRRSTTHIKDSDSCEAHVSSYIFLLPSLSDSQTYTPIMADFTARFRRTTYPIISPSNPANDQSGRTVLITGSSEGIGLSTAQAYAQANAARVILCSRSQTKLDQAVSHIKNNSGKEIKTQLIARILDASSIQDIASFWQYLQDAGIIVDVLVLNASALSMPTEVAGVVEHFHFNITARLYMLSYFQAQPASSQKILIDISSGAIHAHPFPMAAYSASKAGFTAYLNHISHDPTCPFRVVSLHPGSVYTAAVRGNPGLPPQEANIWDDPSLSAHMGLWLSTDAAAFLHGRYVWANWDVEELIGMKGRLETEPGLLRIGFGGVGRHGMQEMMKKCEEVPRPKSD